MMQKKIICGVGARKFYKNESEASKLEGIQF